MFLPTHKMETVIQSAQDSFDSTLRTQNNITYETAVVPEISKILSMLETTNPIKWHIRNAINKPVDIYTEAVAAYILRHRDKPTSNIPANIIAPLLLIHPFMINVIQEHHNYETWEPYRERIFDLIKTYYNGDERSKDILTILEQKTPHDMSKLSALSRFHSLLGFTFKSETTAVPASALQEQFKQLDQSTTIIIAINVANNIEQLESIICYRNVQRSKTKFVSPEFVKQCKQFHKYGIHQDVSKPFNILDAQFQPLNKLPESFTSAIVVLNYNDTPQFENNHYTVAYFRDSITLTKSQATEFMEFKLLYSVGNDLITTDIKEDFYTRIYYVQTSLDELKRKYTKFMNIVSRVYNEHMTPPHTKEVINNFIDKLTIEAVAEGCIIKQEVPFFKVYLSKLHSTVTDIGHVVQFVLTYIYPDLLTSSMSMLS